MQHPKNKKSKSKLVWMTHLMEWNFQFELPLNNYVMGWGPHQVRKLLHHGHIFYLNSAIVISAMEHSKQIINNFEEIEHRLFEHSIEAGQQKLWVRTTYPSLLCDSNLTMLGLDPLSNNTSSNNFIQI